MSMGARLAQARRGQNMTQEQLAEKLGVTRQAVSRWESDTAYPETDKIVRMAALFGVSCDYLLGASNEPSPTGDKPPSPVTSGRQDGSPGPPSAPSPFCRKGARADGNMGTGGFCRGFSPLG